MDKSNFEIWMMEYLSGELNEKEGKEFREFLQENPKKRNLFDDLKRSWNQIDSLEVPEPSEKMDTAFYDMLHSKMEAQKKPANTFSDRLQAFLESLWKPQLAYGLLLLGVGLGIGFFMNPDTVTEPVKTTIVSNPSVETEDVREKLVLTLLEQPSANKRLQGVSEANKIRKVDEKVIRALLQTLNNDPNVNVRLAAIESLTNYVDNPLVREGLVQSIVKQDAPIVQVTLANLMVALQEKKSIEPFKKLMRSKELNTEVKKKLESSIQQII